MSIFEKQRKSYMDYGNVCYWTTTIYKWKHLLKPDKYKDIVIESLTTLCARECISIYGFVIMPNHIHLLWELLQKNGKENPQASFLKYTAHVMQDDLRMHHPDVLEKFYVNERDRDYRFWLRDPLAVEILSREMAEQKLDYIHLNPLNSRWNLATRPEGYYYSSAKFYETGVSDFGFLTHYRDRL